MHLNLPKILVALFLLSGRSHGLPTPGENETSPVTPGDPAAPLPQCAKVTCTPPPEGLKCNKTEIKNPGLLKKVGKLKDCCSAWRCQEEDGSFSTYFGMSGTESIAASGKKGSETKTKASPTQPPPPPTEKVTTPTTTTTTTTTTPKPTTTTTKPTTTTTTTPPPTPAPEEPKPEPEEKPTEDKCSEARAKCPLPEASMDTCTVTMSKDAMQFKPKGELDACCPIYNCTMADGSYRLHYLMSGGLQPKKAAAIAKEKGEPAGDNKCPNIQCAQEPDAGDEGPVCKKFASADTDSPRIKELGPFQECCDTWKCTYPDTSYYTHFELQATSFWLAETTFQSEPASTVVSVGIEDEPMTSTEPPTEPPPTTENSPVSGDEVAQAESIPIIKLQEKKLRPPQKASPVPINKAPPPPPSVRGPKGSVQSNFKQSSFNAQNAYASSFSNSFANSSSWSYGDEQQSQEGQEGVGQSASEGQSEEDEPKIKTTQVGGQIAENSGQDISSEDLQQPQQGQTQEGVGVAEKEVPVKSGRKEVKFVPQPGPRPRVQGQPGMGGMGMGRIPMGPPPGTLPRGMGGMGMGNMGMGGMMMQQQMMMPPMNMYGPPANMFGR